MSLKMLVITCAHQGCEARCMHARYLQNLHQIACSLLTFIICECQGRTFIVQTWSWLACRVPCGACDSHQDRKSTSMTGAVFRQTFDNRWYFPGRNFFRSHEKRIWCLSLGETLALAAQYQSCARAESLAVCRRHTTLGVARRIFWAHGMQHTCLGIRRKTKMLRRRW